MRSERPSAVLWEQSSAVAVKHLSGTALHFRFHCFAMKVRAQALTHSVLVGVSAVHCNDCSAPLKIRSKFPTVPYSSPQVSYSSLKMTPTVQLQLPTVSIHYLTVHFQFAYSSPLSALQFGYNSGNVNWTLGHRWHIAWIFDKLILLLYDLECDIVWMK